MWSGIFQGDHNWNADTNTTADNEEKRVCEYLCAQSIVIFTQRVVKITNASVHASRKCEIQWWPKLLEH